MVAECAYCGRNGGRDIELIEPGCPVPEVFTICGGCMWVALMRFEESIEDQLLFFVGAQSEPPTP